MALPCAFHARPREGQAGSGMRPVRMAGWLGGCRHGRADRCPSLPPLPSPSLPPPVCTLDLMLMYSLGTMSMRKSKVSQSDIALATSHRCIIQTTPPNRGFDLPACLDVTAMPHHQGWLACIHSFTCRLLRLAASAQHHPRLVMSRISSSQALATRAGASACKDWRPPSPPPVCMFAST